jgi:hypothetical protein
MAGPEHAADVPVSEPRMPAQLACSSSSSLGTNRRSWGGCRAPWWSGRRGRASPGSWGLRAGPSTALFHREALRLGRTRSEADERAGQGAARAPVRPKGQSHCPVSPLQLPCLRQGRSRVHARLQATADTSKPLARDSESYACIRRCACSTRLEARQLAHLMPTSAATVQ